MQLHSLTVTAFGPFADTQQVDFDALADGGLFLFHGPTGAGKTSILDAVCFAFYGQVPGARSASRSLRSDHAAPGARPEVVLEATVRGRRLRLTRSPQWERPKRRGSGGTTEPAHVHLQERQAGEWSTVSTRLDETGKEVRERLGLDLTQFCQVVMLPQGQFAEFLRADADRRRDLLQSLFNTERFCEIERWLVEHRKQSARALEQADGELAEVLARIAQAADASTTPDQISAADAPGWAAALVTEATAAVDRLGSLSTPLELRRTEAATAETHGGHLHEQRTRHAVLQARMGKVTAAATRRRQVAAELDAARRAAPVLPLVAEVARLDESRALASTQMRAHHERLAALGSSVQVAVSGAFMLRSQVDATQAELGALEQLLEAEDEARGLAASIESLTREVVALAQQRDEAARWLAQAKKDLPALRTAVDEAQRAGDRCEAALTTVAALDRRLGAARQRAELDTAILEAGDLLRDAVDLAQQRKAAWLDVRAARIEGMAAELAATLAESAACPVCGSREHPSPARGSGVLVTRDDEAAAEQDASVADEARARVEAGLAALATQQAAAAATAGDGAADQIDVELASAREQLAALTEQAAGLQPARDALAAFEAAADKRAQEQLRLDAQRQATGERARAAEERLHQLQGRLDAARGEDPSVSDRRARLAGLVDHLGGLVEAVAAVDRLGAEVVAARRRAAEAAERHGVADVDEVVAHSRPEPVVVGLEEFRRRHDEELATVTELLADPPLVAALSVPAPDLAALAQAAEEADRTFTAHVATLASARTRASQLTALQERLDEVLARRAPLAERHAVVDGLSRLAEGKSADNRLRMSLSGYVLAARLEQVAAAASERLERMSSGRYRLLHAAEGGVGRGRGGLHLRVLDAWTGVDRDPATLSGGESFSASLALALGLADVVIAEAGGSLLETLFVDEGFGTLDDDTLDEVMGVLDDLRDGGRVVGLVSHVADLRQRIPVQLRVEKGRGGSVVRQ
ncbi:MAG: repair protein SbcC/Rad50 [Actinomycetota bacterium]|nr:repair protein SbcC/Rad50 [Actinomycetota bacterium]